MDSRLIKEIALRTGFSACGIARAHRLGAARARFQESLDRGFQADMHYLERDIDKRFDPQELLPG